MDTKLRKKIGLILYAIACFVLCFIVIFTSIKIPPLSLLIICLLILAFIMRLDGWDELKDKEIKK